MIALQFDRLKEEGVAVAQQEQGQEREEHQDAPPKGSSQQWKDLYSAIAAYVKGLKE